ncbi:MAG: nuclear transport factor 2 family protein [Bacteroidales bacterium]
MNRFIIVLFVFVGMACTRSQKPIADTLPELEDTLNVLLNKWHYDAAHANTAAYFDRIADDGVFLGTDPSEHWMKDSFYVWAAPYFEASRTWTFKPIERHWYGGQHAQVVWFDELLETQMGVCRGTGVLQRVNGHWEINHYALSLTLPNSKLREYIELVKK